MSYGLLLEEIGKKPYYSCTLDIKDADSLCCEVLKQADIPGLIRPKVIEENGRFKLLYPLDGYEQLNGGFANIPKAGLKKLILGLCDAEISSEEYMLDDGVVSTEIDSVLWNEKAQKPGFIVIPCKSPNLSLNARFTELLSKILVKFPSDTASDAASNKLSNIVSAFLQKKGETDFYELRRIIDAFPEYGKEASLFSLKDQSIERICRDSTLVGRDRERCSVVPSGGSEISRIHAEIVRENGGVFYIMDSDSANGTYVNGIRLKTGMKYALNNNDLISFAGLEYRFYC